MARDVVKCMCMCATKSWASFHQRDELRMGDWVFFLFSLGEED